MTAMAAEDGYWGSPCSSDSTTNGRDYSPDDSLTNCQPSSASPQYLMSPHQYAPVYYPPQYDRPEIHYEDAATGPTVASTGPAGGYYDAVTSAVADGTPTAASHGETGVPGAAVGIDGIDSTTATSCHHHQLVAAAGGMLDGVQRPVPFVRVVKRRTTANKKERRRTQSINSAFTFLRDCIPNVPSDTKLSKIKTLRLATSYISYLTRVLEGDQDPSGGFRAELVPSSRKINAERRAKYEAQVRHHNEWLLEQCASSVVQYLSSAIPTERALTRKHRVICRTINTRSLHIRNCFISKALREPTRTSMER